MPDVPRDPRQLARDILSGKIPIEDLAREQARARGGAGSGGRVGPVPTPPPLQQRAPTPFQPRPPVQASPMPQKMPMPVQRPMQRAPASFPQRRPVPAPRPQPPRPVLPQGRSTGPLKVTAQPAAVSARSGGALAPTQAQVAAHDAAVATALSTLQQATPQAQVRMMLKAGATVRQGILLAEILGPPAAMRDQW